MLTSHGILQGSGILCNRTPDTMLYPLAHPGPRTLEELLTVAIEGGFTHLWIPEIPGEPLLTFKREDVFPLLESRAKWDLGPDNKLVSFQKNGPHAGCITSITARRKWPNMSRNTRLIFVEQGNWPFSHYLPETILRTIHEIEHDLSVRMSGSPTTTGLRYLERMNTMYREAYFEKSPEIDWSAMKLASVPFLAWFPACNATVGSFLQCYDRNGSHSFAACKEKFGIGTPYLRTGGPFDRTTPGLWQVSLRGNAVFEPGLPPLLPAREWLPTALLRVAELAGAQIEVSQALLWPKKAPVFERWATNLWNLRAQYPRGSIGEKSYKAIMNSTTGALRRGEEADVMMRPDWYAAIVASERAVVWWTARKILREQSLAPVGAYVDALYYLSPHADPRRAVPGLLDHANSLGGYKHAFTLPVTPEVAAILAMTAPGAARRIAALKKVVSENGFGRSA